MGGSRRKRRSGKRLRVHFSEGVPQEVRTPLAETLKVYWPKAFSLALWDLRRRVKRSLARRGLRLERLSRSEGALYLAVRRGEKFIVLRIQGEE